MVTAKGRAQEISGPQLRLWHAGLADVILSNRVAQDLRLIALTSRRLTGVAASIILIEEKSDILTRFLRATIEGNFVALRDPARARKILARDAGIKGARAIDASYRDFQAQSLPDMDISVADVQQRAEGQQDQPRCRLLCRWQPHDGVAQERLLRNAAEEIWDVVIPSSRE